MLAQRASVMVVDDDGVSRLTVGAALKQGGFEVIEADNGGAALKAFGQAKVDLILLDVMMPVLDGFACCRALRELPHGAHVPILMMTGLEDVESINRAFHSGATDFITKPINYSILPHRVRYMLRAANMADELRRSEARLANAQRMTHLLTYFDNLTGLPNRALLQQHLTQALELARRHRRILAVLAIDIDDFSRVNDSLGHEVGDVILKELAARISGCLRTADLVTLDATLPPAPTETVARVAGDEFIVVLTEVLSVEDAAVVARRIREVVSRPVAAAGREIVLTACIGISAYPVDGDGAETLLKEAAAALNHAKTEGRDSYQFYTTSLNTRAFQRLTLEAGLRRGLKEDQFELYYQPRMSVDGRRMTGMEALLRWRHPELGLVSPAEFIPIAEETGLIIPLGEWVLRQACRDTRHWAAKGLSDLSVAVNLSAAQFKEPRLDRVVGHVLDETGLKPHQLELELTETMVMRDGERTAELLARLHGLGVKLSIDDFGTGYSSLSYLKRFPLSGLKIDRSFVRDMAVDHDDAMIVAAIIALARSLRLKVVAEGVEEAEQIRLLAAQGCDELQGFFFTPPLPAAEFERWVFERLRPAPGRGEEDTSLCPLQASGSRLQAIRNAEA